MRIVVTGASGQLGSHLLERLTEDPHEVFAWSGPAPRVGGNLPLRAVDLTDALAVAAALDEADPDVVIHLAAISSTEGAYRDPKLAAAVNVAGTRLLTDWATRHGRRVLYTSSDLVFDGSRSWYREGDPAVPILEYGRTKLHAEPAVRATARGLVARLSLLYGASRSGKAGYFDRAMAALRAATPQSFFIDEFRTPLDFDTAAGILIGLAESDATGLIHVGGTERLSRFELMRRAAVAQGIDPGLIHASNRAGVPSDEPRPADVSLDTSRLAGLFSNFERPAIEAALASSRG